ncbi:transcription factor 7 [Pelobates cultripes]|uniref:Transcription factor 7 n=1 Tax=Pelobates cultripes TaxID=61616 RepID=A0AAD1VYN7_PELCU|nr:transcription factor 7 [Pelobates cultripes]
MPQLNSGGEDDLGANDEMISFKDEGEQEEKIQENAFTERDLADLKSSLVNESETRPATSGPDSHTEALRRAQDAQRAYQEKLSDHMEDDIKHQEEIMYKGSGYSSYPFLMLSDPYLPNGPMSSLVRLHTTTNTLFMSGSHHVAAAPRPDYTTPYPPSPVPQGQGTQPTMERYTLHREPDKQGTHNQRTYP